MCIFSPFDIMAALGVCNLVEKRPLWTIGEHRHKGLDGGLAAWLDPVILTLKFYNYNSKSANAIGCHGYLLNWGHDFNGTNIFSIAAFIPMGHHSFFLVPL